MADIGIFAVLNILTAKGTVEATDQNTSFCDCCEKTHFRQWYKYKRTGDSFYVCTPTWMVNVNYTSGKWGHLTLADLVNHLI